VSGASVSRVEPGGRRRLAFDLLLLGGIGLLMTALGPYRTLEVPDPLRAAYWVLAVTVAGLAGIVLDSVVGQRFRSLWIRVAAVSLIMTVPVTPLVYLLNAAVLDLPRRPWLMPQLAGQVFVVALLIMALRTLLWRRIVETRIVVEPPLPEAERAFRLRLSARRRRARLIALEAEDHYVRVHTDQGSELVSMRFADALEELSQAHGHRLHRSWWVAADALEAVRWRRGGGEALLANGLTAPVSRNYSPDLKRAGWR
jgi:hypothetical protein